MAKKKSSQKNKPNKTKKEEKNNSHKKKAGIDWEKTTGKETITLVDYMTAFCHPTNRFWFAIILNHFILRKLEGFGTMGVGIEQGRTMLFYDDRIIATCKRKEVERILIHEVLHIILKHIPRKLRMLSNSRSERVKRGINAFFNIAADYAVNSYMLQQNYWTKEEEESAVLQGVYPDQMGLPNDLSTEGYLAHFLQQLDNDAQQLLQDLLDVGYIAGPQEDEDGNQQSPDGWPQDENGNSKKPADMSDDEAEEQILGGIESRYKNHDKWTEDPNLTPEELEAMADAVERRSEYSMAQAIKTLDDQKNRGTVPGFLQSLLDEYFNGTPIPWNQQLAMCLRSGDPLDREESFARPHRGRMLRGLYGGCPFPGFSSNPTCRVAFAIDTSGSMSDHELQLVLKELRSFVRGGGFDIQVIQFDTHVHSVQQLEQESDIKPEFKGRGGTDFNLAFKEAAKMNPDIMITYTDGYAPLPEEENRFPDAKVIWLLTPTGVAPGSGYSRNESTCQYGRTIRIIED